MTDTNNKTSVEKMYRTEKNANVKERMLLLVLNVMYYGKLAAHVVMEIHKSKGWASQWLKRYKQEGIEELKDKPKRGRRPELSSEIEYRIKTILRESSNHGWTTKQVEEIIIKESGIRYHYTNIYRILRKLGFKQKVPRKVHINTASKEEKEEFKKRSNRYL